MAVVLAIVGLTAWFAWPNRMHVGPRNSVLMDLDRLNGAKEQWKLEQKPSGVAWPAKAEIVRYLGRHGSEAFEDCLRPLNGEIYVINRADRPVAVYLTKDAFGFKEGQLLTIEDIEQR